MSLRQKEPCGSKWFAYVGSGILTSLFYLSGNADAQVISDGTVGTQVTSVGNNYTIDKGTQVGPNLFHSFTQFSVPTGGSAFFNNASNVQNIFSRVTGGQVSTIDGLIRANGTANLFLLNPSGILFGPQARLNLGGSFVGSTAHSLRFSNGGEFSATVPQKTPLLTVSVPVGLQFGTNPGLIQVQGNSYTGLFPTPTDLQLGAPLGVALVGGDVVLQGGTIGSLAGRVEVGSVRGGMVKLQPTVGGVVLDYSSIKDFRDITLRDRAGVASFNGANNPVGGIYLHGRTVTLERSQVASLTTGNVSGSPIEVKARNALNLGGGVPNPNLTAGIVAPVLAEGRGAGGAIRIEAPQLNIRDGGRIQSVSLGSGKAGDINIDASNIHVSGFAPLNPAIAPTSQNTNSRISSDNLAGGTGGTVRVKTDTLTLVDGGQILTSAGPLATGVGGSLQVAASGNVRVVGINPFNPDQSSGLHTLSLGGSRGGDITFSAANVTFLDGGRMRTALLDKGSGGNIQVDVKGTIEGHGTNRLLPLHNGVIIALGYGPGDTGNVAINAQRLFLTGGAEVGAAAFGQGNSGDVTLNIRDSVELIGHSLLAKGDAPSGIVNATLISGKAGNVSLATRKLIVRDGAVVFSASVLVRPTQGPPRPQSGTGSAGNLVIDADSIEVSGIEPTLLFPSTVSTFTSARGNAGDTTVNARQIVVRDGGLIGSYTTGLGNAGRLTLNATESILVEGVAKNGTSALIGASAVGLDPVLQQIFFLPPLPSGNVKEMSIVTDKLTLRNGGRVGVQHDGTGNAGNLLIQANSIFLDNGGAITASTRSGEGGNMNLQVDNLLRLRHNSRIEAQAGGSGNGGNITINAPIIGTSPAENSDIIANAITGRGGNIDITTQGVYGLEFRPQLTFQSDITASSEFGVSGTVQINTFSVTPTSGVVPLQAKLVDPSQQIAPGCTENQSNSFVVTGRGGLPTNPTQKVNEPSPWSDIRDPSAYRQAGHGIESVSQPDSPVSPLVEATAWRHNPDGQMELFADGRQSFATSPPTTCPTLSVP